MRASLNRRSFAFVIVLTIGLGLSATSEASEGYVYGRFTFINANGNFCPNTNACVGAKYKEPSNHQPTPVPNAALWIVDGSNAILGLGRTDDDGYYNIKWERPFYTNGPDKVRVIVYSFHKDSRIKIYDINGNLFGYGTEWIWWPERSFEGTRQVGTFQIGSTDPTNPWSDHHFNAYWAAEKMWREVLSPTGLHTINFTDVNVRGFADDIPGFLGTAPTSAAQGSTKRVQLDANAGFAPQWRVMHELGHVASYVSNPFKAAPLSFYGWTQASPTAGPANWAAATPENGYAAFEESWASHYGNIAFWNDNAATPTTCLSNGGHCYTGGGVPLANTDLEASSNPPAMNSCNVTAANPESRWPISVMRFLWDVYDNVNDNDTYSASQTHFWQHIHNLAWYPAGNNNNQVDDIWDGTLANVTEPDGRGTISWVANYQANVTGVGAVSGLRTINCSPF
jgi:hypothetical protein